MEMHMPLEGASQRPRSQSQSLPFPIQPERLRNKAPLIRLLLHALLLHMGSQYNAISAQPVRTYRALPRTMTRLLFNTNEQRVRVVRQRVLQRRSVLERMQRYDAIVVWERLDLVPRRSAMLHGTYGPQSGGLLAEVHGRLGRCAQARLGE